jgi:hypothetical protein
VKKERVDPAGVPPVRLAAHRAGVAWIQASGDGWPFDHRVADEFQISITTTAEHKRSHRGIGLRLGPHCRWHGAQRVQERDKPDESSNTVTAQTSLKLKHRAQQACRMIHTIRAQHFQLQQQHNMSREAKRRNDRQAEAERAVHQSHGCSFERFSLR